MTRAAVLKRWQSAKPRERDATVAEALGHRIVWQEFRQGDPEPWIAQGSDSHPEPGWSCPHYATRERAGELLERMEFERLIPAGEVRLTARADGAFRCQLGNSAALLVDGPDWPSAIALCFLLAMAKL